MVATNNSSVSTLGQELGLASGRQMLAVTAGNIGETTRKRADQSLAAIANAPFRRWAWLGLLFWSAALLCAITAIIVPTGGLLPGIATTLVFFGALSLALANPRKVLRVVDNFVAFAEQTVTEVAATSRRQAQVTSQQWKDTVDRFVRQQQGARAPQAIKRDLQEALDQVRAVDVETQTMLGGAIREAESALQSASSRTSEMRAKVDRPFFSRLLLRSIRRLARQAIELQEQATKHRRHRATIEAFRAHALTPLINNLNSVIDDTDSEHLEFARIAQGPRAEQADIEPDASILWPPAPDIRHSVSEMIGERLPEIRAQVAARDANVPMVDALRTAIGGMIASHPVVSDDLGEHLEQLNGKTAGFLRAALDVARQWARHNDAIHPSEGHWEVTTLVARGGESSPLYRKLRGLSDGQTVRAIHTDSREEVILLTESRYERADSHSNLVEYAGVLSSSSAEQLAVMSPIEDIDFLLAYTPEQPDEREAITRILALAMVLRVVVRDGAVLRIANGFDYGPLAGGRIGRGWDVAVSVLKTNRQVRSLLEGQVKNLCDDKGGTVMAKLIAESLRQPNLFPAAQLDDARRVLMLEQQRFSR